jgi:WD40 repeat protein
MDSKNGRNFISGGWDCKILIYDIYLEKPIKEISAPGNYIERLVYMEDCRTLVSGGNDGFLRVWR